jgi:hypothetical protein
MAKPEMSEQRKSPYLLLREALLSRLTGDLDYDAKIVADFYEKMDINPPDPIDRMLTHISFIPGAMD